MNGSAAKSFRRDLRRAFGPHAVASLQRQDQQIHETRTAVGHDIGVLIGKVEAVERQLAVVESNGHGFVRQSFRQRMRWLLLGA